MINQMERERAKVVIAMETIAWCINDDENYARWRTTGVADGDITDETTLDDVVDMGYCDDETFRDLVGCFLHRMRDAIELGGGLYYDGFIH